MCVLTFYPLKDGFILTNNRDENLSRPKAIPPKKFLVGNEAVYFPKDSLAGGTWLAVSKKYTICLLNGAIEKHVSQPPYRKSRGHVILDIFKKKEFKMLNNSEFEGVENFTMIIFENQKKTAFEYIWDGNKLLTNEIDCQKPKIWSSSTLYDKPTRQKRENLFLNFLTAIAQPSNKELIQFHEFADTGNIENNLVMRRPDGTVTQSISQVIQNKFATKFIYKDLLEKKQKSLLII